jgi:hypothetical protein
MREGAALYTAVYMGRAGGHPMDNQNVASFLRWGVKHCSPAAHSPAMHG